MDNFEVENNKDLIFKNALRYGILAGFVMLFIRFAVTAIGYDFYRVSIVSFIAVMAAVHIGTKNYRDRFSGGYIKYGRAVLSGFLISLIAGLVYGLYVYFEYRFIFPESYNGLLRLQEELIREGELLNFKMFNNLFDEEEKVKILYNTASEFKYAFSETTSTTFMGTLISLFMARLLKK